MTTTSGQECGSFVTLSVDGYTWPVPRLLYSSIGISFLLQKVELLGNPPPCGLRLTYSRVEPGGETMEIEYDYYLPKSPPRTWT